MIGRFMTGMALVFMTLGGCSDEAARTLAVPHVFDLNVDPAANIAEVDAARTDVLTAAELRGVLEQGLAWHGVTLVEVMRSARGDNPEVQVWIDELVANTDSLTAAVGVVYGPVGARAFNQQWAQHTQFLVDYAVAIGAGDDASAAEARANLVDYANDAASFFETALGEAIPAAAVEALLTQHIEHMLDLIEADHAGDVASTAELAMNDSLLLSDIALALASAITGQQSEAFPGSTETPDANFCSIVTKQTSAFLVANLTTRNPNSAAVRNASTVLATSTGVSTAVVVGQGAALPLDDEMAVAAAARAALDHAIDWVAGQQDT